MPARVYTSLVRSAWLQMFDRDEFVSESSVDVVEVIPMAGVADKRCGLGFLAGDYIKERKESGNV